MRRGWRQWTALKHIQQRQANVQQHPHVVKPAHGERRARLGRGAHEQIHRHVDACAVHQGKRHVQCRFRRRIEPRIRARALAIDDVPHPTRQAVVHNLYNEVTRKHEGRGAFVQNVGHQVRRRAAKDARQAEEQAEHRAKRRCRAHLHDVVELRDGKKGFEDYQIHDKASNADAQRVLPGSPRVRRRGIFGRTGACTFCLIGRGRPRRCIVFRLNRTHCLPPPASARRKRPSRFFRPYYTECLQRKRRQTPTVYENRHLRHEAGSRVSLRLTRGQASH